MQVGSGKIVEVEPSGGTLVIFESRRVWHEVLPSMRRLRFALTLWVYAAPVAPTSQPSDKPSAATAASTTSPILSLATGTAPAKPATQRQPQGAPLLMLTDRDARTEWKFI